MDELLHAKKTDSGFDLYRNAPGPYSYSDPTPTVVLSVSADDMASVLKDLSVAKVPAASAPTSAPTQGPAAASSFESGSTHDPF